MKDDLDNLEDVNKNIEDDNIGENNDENSSDSFLKIDPIKGLDSSNIKIDIPKTEIKKEVETPKKQAYKQTKEDIPQNDKPVKDNSKIIKIGIVALIILLCLGGGYFAYSKFMVRDESENLAGNTVTEEIIEESPQEVPIKEANNITETPIVEPVAENFQEQEEVKEEPVIEDKNTVEDDLDLIVLETVYDEVINKGNEDYLYNFTPSELAIIRNTLYARRGYKFKKKEYQKYFGEKSWYVPTTNSQNILTKNEEKLANIIKRYE